MTAGGMQAKSVAFAVRIVTVCAGLSRSAKARSVAERCRQHGTSIGTLLREADQAGSKADAALFLMAALKAADDTDYCLELLRDSGALEPSVYSSLKAELVDLSSYLAQSVNLSDQQ